MESLLNQFYQRLPARDAAADDCLHLLNDKEVAHVRRSQRQVMLVKEGDRSQPVWD